MSTIREQAQFIDELRQHYRRLDGLLVKHKDKLGPIDVWEFNHPVIALRKLLFGGVGDPNWIGAAGQAIWARRASEVDPGIENSPAGGNPASPVRLMRLVEDAPTAPMSVHDPAEDLEVIP